MAPCTGTESIQEVDPESNMKHLSLALHVCLWLTISSALLNWDGPSFLPLFHQILHQLKSISFAALSINQRPEIEIPARLAGIHYASFSGC